jgi:hypothetical protein
MCDDFAPMTILGFTFSLHRNGDRGRCAVTFVASYQAEEDAAARNWQVCRIQWIIGFLMAFIRTKEIST